MAPTVEEIEIKERSRTVARTLRGLIVGVALSVVVLAGFFVLESSRANTNGRWIGVRLLQVNPIGQGVSPDWRSCSR